MAMNKREQAMVNDLRLDLARARAWKLTERIDPDILPPSHNSPIGTMTRGWLYHAGSYRDKVYKACSTSISHGAGWERTTTQQPRALYSTEERAWRALRWHVEQQALNQLAEIDRGIADAIARAAQDIPTTEDAPR